jgi:hypothetical protein
LKDVQVQRGLLTYDRVLLTQMRNSPAKLLGLPLDTPWRLRVRVFVKHLLFFLLDKSSLIELLTPMRSMGLLPFLRASETLDW